MDQVQRVQSLLSYQYPIFTVSAIDDIAAICGVSYKMVVAFLSLTRLQGQNPRTAIIELIRHYRPDILLQLLIDIPEDRAL